ncbi:MAG: hypothetical protein DRP03_00015 [Candidatus Aenigmatarchaeota archaeon]|nr:MAG: hypothetical protein DRP03_00015 [Candidatus Aenigmarchaeota archaeon]
MKKRISEIEMLKGFLEAKGFNTFTNNGCFDIIAKKGRDMFLLKVLLNIDSLTENEARNLKIIAKYMSATPIIIGKRTRKENLHDFAVYERFGIPSITNTTFKNYIAGIKPFIKATRGGLRVKVDSKKINKALSKYSLHYLAQAAGISIKTARKCRDGNVISLEMACRVEELLNDSIACGIDLEKDYKVRDIEATCPFERLVEYVLGNFDMAFSFVKRTPFNMLLKKDEIMISTTSQNMSLIKNKIQQMRTFKEKFDVPSFIIIKRTKRKVMAGLPIFGIDEIKDLGCYENLCYEVKERSAARV